jgi:hypothetical protein
MNAYLSRITPDAALIAADRRHSALADLINDDRTSEEAGERLCREQSAAERVLVLSRAETGEGLRAKARTLRRLVCGGNACVQDLPESLGDDVGRLMWSLLQDILHQRALIDMVAFEAALTSEGMRS